ncbi:NAD-dependent epimerase/dehydratase family protein [Maribacter forsetii]|uniref:NAD-dependent epimerase/dehydratase family protein n=1 Tax=Maribacter forsetii TaxID=444515 RepID=UPI00055F5B04|nr:NAD-dependent epimerase/dehydratase [Maribacter forsetii]
METILLTGGTGFLGSHLLKSFVAKGHKVGVLKRSTSNTYRIEHLTPKVKLYDIDKVSLKKVFEDFKPNIIVHTACAYDRKNIKMSTLIETNILFGIQLLQEAIINNVSAFINTDTLLPKNINNYSLSKAQFREWLIKYSKDIKVINIKPEHMYGPLDDDMKFIPWLIDRMLNDDDEINLTSGIQKRDFIYIDDVVNAFDIILKNVDNLKGFSEFDLGTNKFISVKEVILSIAKQIENRTELKVVPRLKFGIISYREGEIMEPILDITELLRLGWKPEINLEEGVQKILS